MISIKEENFWLHGGHQNSRLTKFLIIRLCIIKLSERMSSSLTVFLNGYEHIEVLLNPCKINQDQKSGILFRGSIHLTCKMSQGVTAKDPRKGSRVNSILYINDPMPTIQSQKVDKSQKTPMKAISTKTKY